MKLLTTAFVAVQAAQAINFQQVGYCGIPSRSFNEDVLIKAQQRSNSGAATANALNEANAQAQAEAELCENEFTAEHGDGKTKEVITIDVERLNEAKRTLHRIEKACQDNRDRGYEWKKLDNGWHNGEETVFLLNHFMDLKSEASNALIDDLIQLDDKFSESVEQLRVDIEETHHRCNRAIERLEAIQEEHSYQNFKSANSENEEAAYLEKKAEQCTDSVKVVGGEDAQANAWPWQVYLSICGTFFGLMECNVCGGSLISNKWIATAAHCVPYQPRGRILVGAHDLNEKKYNSYALGEMIKHYLWNYPGKFQNDIALTSAANGEIMSIDWAVSAPVCLPHKESCFSDGMTCVVTGWGLTEERGKLADTLQVVGVKLMNHDQCKTYKNYENIADTMLCAGFEQGSHDACSGDSGGPLVCRVSDGKSKGAWVLHGIVSWGYGCARPNSPGIYTRVTEYLDWIEKITRPAEDKPGLKPDDRLIEDVDTDFCSADIPADDSDNFVPLPAEIDVEAVAEQEQGGVCNYDRLSSGFQSFTNTASGINANGDSIARSVHDEISMGINFERVEILEATNCLWTWQNTDSDRYIKLSISAYLQENCKDMSEQDKIALTIKYKDGDDQKQTISVCSTKGPLKIMSKSFISIQFESRHRQFGSLHKLGFQLTWEYADDTFHCAGDSSHDFSGNGDTFKIASPQFPKRYNSQQECRWQLSAPEEMTLYFKQFATENRKQCDKANDNLIIYYAPDCKTSTLSNSSMYRIHSVLCGIHRNKSVTIQKDTKAAAGDRLKVCVVFIGDKDGRHGKGFTSEITATAAKSGGSAVKPSRKPGRNNRGKGKGKGRGKGKNRKRG